MPDEARLIFAFTLAVATALAMTPVAMAVAGRTGFHDRPIGYKGHSRPTPYLGGAAVVIAFLLAGITAGGELARLSPIVACTFAVWCLGTTDDKLNLSPFLRLAVEFGVASALWAAGLGWSVTGSEPLDLFLSIFWVVGLVNAFNLMDNMDGAAATVGAVTTMATAVLAFIQGDLELAILCVAMSGACLGFLPYNLAGPARIFLGDGGSLTIGFLVAATIMALPGEGATGVPVLLAAVILAGLPVVDTALVVISRRRARVELMKGGLDHMTHRLVTRLGTPRRVALSLGMIQALLGAVAIGVVEAGEGSVLTAGTVWFVVATAAVVLLETRTWAPDRSASPVPVPAPVETEAAAGGGRPRIQRSPSLVEGLVLVFITTVCGLSPALFGFYKLSVWGPIALVVLAVLLGLTIARPASPRPTALVAIGGLVFLWLWALASVGWSESADQALLDANRWMLYAAVFTVLVLLLRDDRLGRLLMAAATAAVVAFGLYLCARLLLPDSGEMFLNRRLNDPLGYVNGQAGYLLLALWPLVAAAERTRSHLLSGAAVSAAVLLAGLALLGQTRAVVPAVIVSAVVLVAVLPGRGARLWALVAIAAGVGLAAGPLLAVYDSATGSQQPDEGTIRAGVLALIGAAVLAGGIWAAARYAAGHAVSRSPQRARMASVVALAAVGLVVAVGGFVAVGNPVDRARTEVRAFKNLDSGSAAESRTRFTSGGGNRYDYWRVAANQFKDHPLKGIGAGNYDRTYFLERRTVEDVRQAHSLPLQVLGDLGLVGGVGLLLFVGAVLAGFARRARAAARGSERDLTLAVAGGGMFLVWLVHTSVDWLHLIPGVTGIALCGAAVLVAPWSRVDAGARRSPVRLAVGVTCALVVLAGAVLVGRATLADKYRSESQEIVASDPGKALGRAADSLSLNDEALPAYYARAAAYARVNDYDRARGALLEATRREPHDFVTWGLLGDLALRRGNLDQAKRAYARASQLNPRDTGLKQAARDPRAAREEASG
jgi:UDP-GlcNAc:undecaprenyl-phosphate GlcNAc-1-phosphate transferase